MKKRAKQGVVRHSNCAIIPFTSYTALQDQTEKFTPEHFLWGMKSFRSQRINNMFGTERKYYLLYPWNENGQVIIRVRT